MGLQITKEIYGSDADGNRGQLMTFIDVESDISGKALNIDEAYLYDNEIMSDDEIRSLCDKVDIKEYMENKKMEKFEFDIGNYNYKCNLKDNTVIIKNIVSEEVVDTCQLKDLDIVETPDGEWADLDGNEDALDDFLEECRRDFDNYLDDELYGDNYCDYE